jgi:hypothetical protein
LEIEELEEEDLSFLHFLLVFYIFPFELDEDDDELL